MPVDPSEFLELVYVFLTFTVTMIIMVLLGRWWAN